MKKNSKKSFFGALKSPLGKSSLVLAFFIMAAGVYGAITYPTAPNPMTGLVGTWVANTPATYDGNDANGYETATTYCDAQEPNSHVCSPAELINTYNNNPLVLTGQSDTVWVNTGASTGVISANDCEGWTSDSTVTTAFGTAWNLNTGVAEIHQCHEALPYGCCM